MQNTTNYGLNKPEKTDYININDFNDNADIIDNKLKENADAITSHKNENASTSNKGHVQLSSAIDSDSETLAATSKAVKTTMDKANEANAIAMLMTGHLNTRLAENCQQIDDWNNATKNGFYMATNANNAPNTEWFMGIAICHNANWVEQRICAFSTTREVYVRHQMNAQWLSWQKQTIGDLNELSFGSKTSIVSSMNELFQYASDGKTKIANAITGKGIVTNPSDTFDAMANNITNIKVGDYSIGDYINIDNIQAEILEVWRESVSYILYAIAVDSNANVYFNDSEIVRKINSSGSQVWSFTGHTGTIYGVAVDNDGNVYSGSGDKTVRKINSSGSQVWINVGHTGIVYGVAVDNDGYTYTCSADKTVRKFNSSGSQVWSFTGHVGSVYSVAVDGSGNVYSGSADNTVRKINSSGSQVWSFTGYTTSPYGVAVDGSGNVYVASLDKTVRKINSSGSQVWSFTGHTGTVRKVTLDGGGNVYSAGGDGTIRKLNNSGSEMWSFNIGGTNEAIAVDNDGNVYSGGNNKAVLKIQQRHKIIA